MAKSIDPTLRDYFRARMAEWVAQEGHTAKELASLAGLSGAQISDAINKGSIGWGTMQGVMPVLGLRLDTVGAEAERWALTRAPAEAAPPSRRGYRRLQERPEWVAVAAAVADEHGELEPDDIAMAGRFPDDELAFAGPLDAATARGSASQRLRRMGRNYPTHGRSLNECRSTFTRTHDALLTCRPTTRAS